MSRTVIIILIYHRHKPIASINLLDSVAEMLRDSCEVRTEYSLHFVAEMLRDSCEVRTESRLHFVVETLCDSCEVLTESRFHFVVGTLCVSCEVRTVYVPYGSYNKERLPVSHLLLTDKPFMQFFG
jgi:hypothetical protein